jgi:hypothetical protein
MPWEPQAEYLAGLVGCESTAETQAEFDAWMWSQGMSPHGEENVNRYGLAGSGAGKLTAHWTIVERLFPGCWPASRQSLGDCVSHSQRNACLYSVACEIAAGKPDEVTGHVEEKPEQPDEGVRDGVFSTEAYYWFRRRAARDGWFCEAAAKVAVEETGAWPRKNYPELGFDLTKYSGSLATRWGSSPPPENIRTPMAKHRFRTAARCESFEVVRDMLHNGYGITSCGGEGFSSTRDDNGVSRRSGSWAHAMAYIGADDRDEVKAKYDGPLVLVMNSWGKWNGGPRRVMGTPLDIPEGSFWARWSDVSRRVAIAMSGFAGWPAQKLPDWTKGIF